MKKKFFVLTLLMLILLTVYSNKNKVNINNLSDTYIYLSELSSTQETISIENIKSILSKFELKKIESEKINLFDSSKPISFSYYEINDMKYSLRIIFNETDQNVSAVYIKDIDNKNIDMRYSGYEKFISITEGSEGENKLYLDAEVKDIEDFGKIAKDMGTSLNSNLFEYFNDLIFKLSTEKKLSLQDIEEVVEFKFTDKIENKDDSTTTYYFSDSNFVIKAVYTNDKALDSIIISQDFDNKNSKIGLNIKYNKNIDSILMNIIYTQKPKDLLNFNEKLFELISY